MIFGNVGIVGAMCVHFRPSSGDTPIGMAVASAMTAAAEARDEAEQKRERDHEDAQRQGGLGGGEGAIFSLARRMHGLSTEQGACQVSVMRLAPKSTQNV